MIYGAIILCCDAGLQIKLFSIRISHWYRCFLNYYMPCLCQLDVKFTEPCGLDVWYAIVCNTTTQSPTWYPHKSCVWLFSESEGTGCCTNKRHKKVSYFGWNFSPHVIGNLLAASALSSWGNARKASKRDCFSASPSFPPVLPYLFMYTLHNRLNSFLLQRVDKLWFRPGYPAKKST